MAEAVLDIKPWGNNLGVRLPAAVARAAQFRAYQRVRITVEDGRVIIQPDPPASLSLEERLARFMMPRYIRFVAVLPKTPTDKVEKFRLVHEDITPDTGAFHRRRCRRGLRVAIGGPPRTGARFQRAGAALLGGLAPAPGLPACAAGPARRRAGTGGTSSAGAGPSAVTERRQWCCLPWHRTCSSSFARRRGPLIGARPCRCETPLSGIPDQWISPQPAKSKGCSQL
jgi:antitoxin MazE